MQQANENNPAIADFFESYCDSMEKWMDSIPQFLMAPQQSLHRQQKRIISGMIRRAEIRNAGGQPPSRGLSDDTEAKVVESIKASRLYHEKSLRHNPVYRSIWSMVMAAEAVEKGLAMVAFVRRMNEDFCLSAIKPFAGLVEAVGHRGEKRAHGLLTCIMDLCPAHEVYLRCLWELQALSDGSQSSPPKQFGALAKAIEHRFSNYKNLWVPRISTVRNARAHGGYTFDPASRGVHLKDRNSIEMHFSNKALLEMARRTFKLHETLFCVSGAYYTHYIGASLDLKKVTLMATRAGLMGNLSEFEEVYSHLVPGLEPFMQPIRRYLSATPSVVEACV